MRPLFILTVALLLAALRQVQTPEDRYFASLSFVKATGEIVETYVDACKTQGPAAPCREKFPKINAGMKALKEAKIQADKVFVSKDSAYYDLSLTVAQNAAMNLRNLIKE